jgi:hypothetical protein
LVPSLCHVKQTPRCFLERQATRLSNPDKYSAAESQGQ